MLAMNDAESDNKGEKMKVVGSIIWVLFSIAILVGGVMGLFVPLDVFASLVFLLPIFLIAGGIGSLVAAFGMQKNGASFILADGLLSIIFGIIFIIGGLETTSLVVIYYIGFMVIFKGILGLGCAFEFKRLNLNWIFVLVFSLLNIIIAFVFIIYPRIGGITIGVIVSLLILFFGLASFVGWFEGRKLFR